MNLRSKRALKYGALLQTASFFSLGYGTAAQAQPMTAATSMPLPEQVLITGSLIHGAAAVGVPVTALSDQDFHETGALTTADVLKEVPSLAVLPSNSATNPGGTLTHPQTVAIHNISSGTGTETLLMIDGMRFPVQGFGTCYIDPSIIPQLALERVDVLADGASATYGSDAVAGVINEVLKRGFEGAISQVQYGRSTDIGGPTYQASQLYGRKWDSGDITLTYEYYHTDPVHGPARPYFTLDFTPFGFNDARPIGSSMPGVVSTGALATDPRLASLGFSARSGPLACTNCFSIPAGTGSNWSPGATGFGPTAPGSAPTVSWTTLLANPGVTNLHDPEQYADILPAQDRNAAVATFDQNLFGPVSFFAEGFYSNRRSVQDYIPGASPAQQQTLSAIPVPTTNPYYPSSAPSGLRISYDLGVEHDSRINSGEIADRYAFGFNVNLPYSWLGKLYYSDSYEGNYAHVSGMVNANMVSAALGNTVTVPAGTIPNAGAFTFTKPANVPYLNVFCDAQVFTCNSPLTMAYINAYRDYDEHWKTDEIGLNLDGPLIDLPGGTARAAVGAIEYTNHVSYVEHSDFSTASTSIPILAPDALSNNIYAAYVQLNIPIFGESNRLPFIEGFDIEAGYRLDHYPFGNVYTPKVAATWNIGEGFAVKGTWGKAFRAPVLGESSAVLGVLVQPINVAAGATTDTLLLNCPSVPGHAAGTAVPGSLNFWLNPTCGAAGSNPGGIHVEGGAGGAAAIRSGNVLGPETSKNWNVGFSFDPTFDLLKGFHLEATLFNVTITGVINGNGTGVINANDPAGFTCTSPTPNCEYIVRARPDLPITDPANAAFLGFVNAIEASPRSVVPPSAIPNIQYLQDNAATNLGYHEIEGVDFNSRYDFDLAEWGAWNVGISGSYKLMDKTQTLPGQPGVEALTGGADGYQLRYRGRLGWAGTQGMADGLSVVGFVNFFPHSGIVSDRGLPPQCYWAPGFSAGSCYPGSPFFGPYAEFPNFSPGLYTFDLSLGYQTGNRPANPYLQNVNFQVTVNDLLNKAPPFEYATQSGRGTAAFVTGSGLNPAYISPLQRFISFTITKSW